VIDANHAALSVGAATGFQFTPVDQPSLEHALARAMRSFADRDSWTAMQRRGMEADLSWERSASVYAALYRNLLKA
jgi:starch synthase